MSLLAEVQALLDQQRVAYALIGAGALAVRGVSRSTADLDLLCVEARILEPAIWSEFESRGLLLRLLEGDSEDPLAGSVRVGDGRETIDVVVGRYAWQREVIDAAESLSLGEVSLPVARPDGLILLKLHAGGPKDAWDILALLEASNDAPAIRASVEGLLPRLPADARRLWSRLQTEA